MAKRNSKLQEMIRMVESAQSEALDLNKVLNDKAFVTFLSKFPDQIDPTNPEKADELSERYESFKTKDLVAQSVVEYFVAKVSKETGVALSREDLAGVKAYFEQMAIENGGEVRAWQEMLVEHSQADERIAQKEDDLKRVLGSLLPAGEKANLEKRKLLVEKVLASKTSGSYYYDMAVNMAKSVGAGVFGYKNLDTSYLKDAYKERAELGSATNEDLAKELADISSKIDTEIKNAKTLEELEKANKQMKDSLADISETIHANSDLARLVRGVVEQKIQDKINGLIDKPDQSLSYALSFAETFDRIRSSSEMGEIDYLANFDAAENIENQLGSIVDRAIRFNFQEAIASFELTRTPLASLEAHLTDFLEIEDPEGERTDDMRATVREMFDTVIESPDTPPEKRILLYAVRAKYAKALGDEDAAPLAAAT